MQLKSKYFGKSITLEFSCDDGHELDRKSSNLLRKYGFKGIFFLPGYCTLDGSFINELATDHEVGSHTWTHPPDIKQLLPEHQQAEINMGKQWLERITGKEASKFAYPRGRFDEHTKQALRNVGIKYARTTRIGNIKLPTDWLEVDTTVHCFQRAEYEGKHWLKYAKEKWDQVKKYGGYYHCWHHSLEIEKHNDWDNLEELYAYIAK